MYAGSALRTPPLDPHCLRQHRLFESHDLDDTCERISRVMQPHTLVPNGRPTGCGAHMDFIRVGGVGLGTIAFGEPMRVDAGLLDNYHLLMFCLRGQAQARADHRVVEVDQCRGILSGADRPFVVDLSGDCEQFVVRLDRQTVYAHTGHWNLGLDPMLDLTSSALQPWLDQLRLLVGSSSLLRLVQQNPLIATDVERLMIDLLVAGQPWQAPGDAIARGPAIAPSCVRKAEAYMEANAAQPLRLGDIAGAAGVPVRTLLDGFQRFRGHSPMQRLREMRLDLANAKLRSPDEETSVAGVALDCGFSHFGRFSEAYRQRFGQSPSATLKRAGG
ncbi:MAG TPA: anthranilate 1,2-dioxygenase regulatory protein AndR [Burkholderiaceae bacterium]|nr:anthranilate 1,2-dioxygenase regulatory protein AndR [Burkholderiaceae bacterium]